MSEGNGQPHPSDEVAGGADPAPAQFDDAEPQAITSLDYARPDTPDARTDDFADELDGLRIRQLTALRRGAIRARSYALIGAAACFVGAIQLVVLTVRHVRAWGFGLQPVGYILFAIVALMLCGYAARRARQLQKEIDTPIPLPPAPPDGPDFSTLSDGSQHWKNLENVQDDDQSPQYPGAF
jgi:hypothetical protein